MPNFVNKITQQEALAAIDLGSNALRAAIVRRNGNDIEVVKSFREPLRLGEDVFQTGYISPQKMLQTEEAFIKLFHIFIEFNVTRIRAMATSAMRDSKNGQELARRISASTGIEIETIRGHKEAALIFEAVKSQLDLKKKYSLIMDIGGGSTEIILVKNDKIMAVKSFNVGTVRLLKLGPEKLKETIKKEVKHMLLFIDSYYNSKKTDLFIGTGGNLRRIGKIRKKMLGKSTSELASYSEIAHMEESIFSMSFVDRIRRLELDQNRADVILPAIMLTQELMKKLQVDRIHLPKVGLKEGIILSMLPHPPRKFILRD